MFRLFCLVLVAALFSGLSAYAQTCTTTDETIYATPGVCGTFDDTNHHGAQVRKIFEDGGGSGGVWIKLKSTTMSDINDPNAFKKPNFTWYAFLIPAADVISTTGSDPDNLTSVTYDAGPQFGTCICD